MAKVVSDFVEARTSPKYAYAFFRRPIEAPRFGGLSANMKATIQTPPLASTRSRLFWSLRRILFGSRVSISIIEAGKYVQIGDGLK
ncbi:hypothetical protein ACFX2F_025777 [Malus domestica]